MANGDSTLLTAPEPELEALSFALAEPESVGEWISRLPMANAQETAGQIRQATFEIARLQTDCRTRMALLEGIRPTVHYLCARLDKMALGASNQSDGVTRLAQRLQTNLSSGYKAVVLEASQAAHPGGADCPVDSLAIHRAISELSRTLLRTLQYYVAPADRLWLNLNQLYLLAGQLGIDDALHADHPGDGAAELSVSGAYLRSLLLALARPYQLRHHQLRAVFQALEGWVQMVSLSGADGDDLYVVDLGSDRGPDYAQSFEHCLDCRGVRSELLVFELDAHLREKQGSIVIPSGFDDTLIQHLVDAWGGQKSRSFSRTETATPIKVSVGMRTTHYFLSGGVDFADQLGGANGSISREINPFLNEDVRFVPNAGEAIDVWANAFDVAGRIPENPNIGDAETVLYAHEPPRRHDPAETYRHYDTTAADMSPGGYRLRWKEPFPANLQTGELIGIREESDPRWWVAVARWIRLDERGPFMGVELLAPQAKPVAIRVVQSRGGHAEYQRALLLPELKPLGRPATLLTPAAPFHAGQKIHLCEDGMQNTAQLGECLLKTESFNQFTFRLLDGYLETAGRQTNMTSPDHFQLQQQTGSR